MSNSDSSEVIISRGLQGVYVDHTETTYIDGVGGVLEYCGYGIGQLAKHSSFEEVTYLLLYGKLPNEKELKRVGDDLKSSRELPKEVYSIIKACAGGHPMDVLRTAVSALSVFDKDRDDNSTEAAYRKGIRLTSQIATIIMAHHRISEGLSPIPPNKEMSHVDNFLYMFDGEQPQKETARLMNVDFVVHADHGLNASAFTSRVVTSTKADFHASITAAIAALSGPSHGGAAENVIQMTREIGTPDKAAEYVANLISSGKRVMGFGHRVYKTVDPRAKYIEEGLKALTESRGDTRWYEILMEVQKAMEPYAKRGIRPNVDYFAGIVYHLLGLPQKLYVPIFAAGRVPGWTIQIVEQLKNNILLRPLLNYKGLREREYVPIKERP